MPTFPKDDIGYESGGWPATDSPDLAAKPAPRRKGRSILKWAPVLTALALAASYLLYHYSSIGR
jgi:hypothetical protein